MTSLTVTSEALSVLGNVGDVVEIRNAAGHVLGYFHPVRLPDTLARSPFTDEMLRQRQAERSGKTLSEVLSDLSSL